MARPAVAVATMAALFVACSGRPGDGPAPGGATPSPSAAAAFVPGGPPLALDLPKFLGSVSSPTQDVNFGAYFDQVTPENGGKWGVVEAVRDQMSWTALDAAWALARDNRLKAPGHPRDGMSHPLPFRLHTLVWGRQQPGWLEALPPDVQRVEVEQWFAALAARYPGVDFIDVVNEPLHWPPLGAGRGNYMAALGGAGATGWDWVITAFEMARRFFPGAQLGVNEYSVTNDARAAREYRALVDLLRRRRLLDYVGIQGHAFETGVASATTLANLDLLAGAGLPLYVTEMDVDGPTDQAQLAEYQRVFPLFWEHPAVRGVTLWGYRPGLWRHVQGAYVVLENGTERPAMVWLRSYLRGTRPASAPP